MSKEKNPAKLFAAHPQVFVGDVAKSCRFFSEKLGFAVRYQYGEPVFYALVQRGEAGINLRHVDEPVLNRKRDRDLLSASIPVRNVRTLFAEFEKAGVAMHQGVQKQPWGVEDFIVLDLDGNLIHFAEAADGNEETDSL